MYRNQFGEFVCVYILGFKGLIILLIIVSCSQCLLKLLLKVIGVAQVINKRGFLDHTFTREDEKVFKKTGLILLCIKINEKM